MIGFIIGLFVGGIIGVSVMCCCRVGREADKEGGIDENDTAD